MSYSTPTLSRRHFLRGSTTLLALPFLESLGFRRFASAEPVVARPKRVVFLGFGWGVTRETWFPDVKQQGSDYVLPEGLSPLARHKSDFTIVQGCTNKFSNEAHWGSTFWLTGANRYAEPGQSFCNSVSADQVAAAHLGKDTRFTSLQLNAVDAEKQGHGPGLSLAWDERGKPVAGHDNPVATFHKLFSAENTSLEQRQTMLVEKRSILDALMQDLVRVKRGLSRDDVAKLDEYAQSIRDIETRIGKEDQWLSRPKAEPPITEPKPGLAGREEIKAMYDLILAAMQTDSTRVVTYRQPVDSLLSSIDVPYSGHDLSHYERSQGDRMEFSQKKDAAQSALLAGLIDKLKATKEPDGSSLLDHTVIVFGSNISSVHFLNNCPTLIAGGGAGIKLGEHLVLPKDTPLCNVWLTILNGLGVKAERHGDSSGVVKQLIA
ncbi:MAG: DUF1552 domain-containing protein [Verrucomicrobiota bacterium]